MSGCHPTVHDFTRDIEEEDREYLEELLGYNQKEYENIVSQAYCDGLTDEDDVSSFAPCGGSMCPSQRFFKHHDGLRREIEDHGDDDKEDDRREREDELEDELRKWYNRKSRTEYATPFILGAVDFRANVGPLQVPEWFAASEILRIQKIVQEDKYRAVHRTKNKSERFIQEVLEGAEISEKEYDKPIREIVGDSLVDVWEFDSARKAEAIRRKLAVNFEKEFPELGKQENKER